MAIILISVLFTFLLQSSSDLDVNETSFVHRHFLLRHERQFIRSFSSESFDCCSFVDITRSSDVNLCHVSPHKNQQLARTDAREKQRKKMKNNLMSLTHFSIPAVSFLSDTLESKLRGAWNYQNTSLSEPQFVLFNWLNQMKKNVWSATHAAVKIFSDSHHGVSRINHKEYLLRTYLITEHPLSQLILKFDVSSLSS